MYTLKRYILLYQTLVRMNFSMLLAYRANFINSFISSVGWGVVSLLSMVILTAKNSSIYGWNRNELLLLTGVYSIVVGVFHTVFSRNFDKFSTIIHKGELDALLLKPVDSQFFVSFYYFHFLGLARIILGIVFCYYMLIVLHVSVTIFSLFFFILLIGIGIILMYSLWFVVITATVWASNLDNLKDFLYQFNNLGRYPSEILYRTGNFFLFLLIPFTYVASIPAKEIIQKVNFFEIILMVVTCIGLFVISRKFWKFALRFYTSASI